MDVLTGYAVAYGWPLDYITTEDLTDATGARFVLTGETGAPIELTATISGPTSGEWRLRHQVATGAIPRGLYTWAALVDFGPTQWLALQPMVLRIAGGRSARPARPTSRSARCRRPATSSRRATVSARSRACNAASPARRSTISARRRASILWICPSGPAPP